MEIIYGFQNPDRTTIEVMTEQQALQENYYHKIFKDDNGLIKKFETYSDQNLLGIDYYLDAGKDESQLLNEFYQSVDYISVFERKTPIGSYFVEREYTKSQQTTIMMGHIHVFDAQDRLVCHVLTDENDNPYIDTTQKYLYTEITTIDTDGTSNSGLFYLEFEYDNGEIIGVDVNRGHVVEEDRHLIDDLD